MAKKSTEKNTDSLLRLIFCLGLLLSSSASHAQSGNPFSSETGPFICHGAITRNNEIYWKNYIGACPDGWAIYSTNTRGVPASTPKEKLLLRPQCCRLPLEDILTEEKLEMEGECPKHFVITASNIGWPEKAHVTCTKINLKRYQLGEATQSWYWGYGAGYWKNSNCIMKRDIPPAIRYGASRIRWGKFYHSGCIGYPFGSLLVAKKGKRCYDHYYSQLQYRGAPGDPTQGTPVTMFPDCLDISDPMDPAAWCIKN